LLQRFLPAVPLALVLLAVGATPAGAVRARGTFDQCVVTWGSFCPVETIGLSLLGSAALAAFGLAIWLVLAKLRDRAGRSGLGGVAALLGLAARYPIHTFAVVVLGVAALFGL
jgi:hypothetical protein